MTPSRKRQKTAPADGDTRVVEYRCDSPPANQEALAELPWGPLYQSSPESECEIITRTRPHYHHEVDEDAIVSSPAHEDDDFILNTPPHYYNDVDEDAIASSPAHENEDDDAFEFSPASPPPLTQSTQEDMASIPRLYVFPDETVVVTADGEHIRIPDQHTITHPKPSTIEDPKPSTSTVEAVDVDVVLDYHSPKDVDHRGPEAVDVDHGGRRH